MVGVDDKTSIHGLVIFYVDDRLKATNLEVMKLIVCKISAPSRRLSVRAC